MKTATVRQLRTEFLKVLTLVNAGKVVASLVPVGNVPENMPTLPDFGRRLRTNYGDKATPADVMADLLVDNRGRF